MKILLADHFGICFGVRDAIAQAEALAAIGPLTILGDLVHNPVVRERLRAQGVEEGSLDHTASGVSREVMITAHGASERKRKEWNAAGFHVSDGTCPLVHHAHTHLCRLVEAGYFPVVIGQPGHVEVRGLTEDFADAAVISESADVRRLPLANRYGVISQTTQPIERVRALVEEMRRTFPGAEVRFVDTVCKPTKDRQLALRRLLAEADLIVVVGGRASNNTRQLVETCRTAGKRALHIERAAELAPTDLAGAQVVGLTAGTSTLPETVQEVHAQMLGWAKSGLTK